jgi:hypothetical protein
VKPAREDSGPQRKTLCPQSVSVHDCAASELSSPVFFAMALAALLAHLACEGFAYVLGALAAILESSLAPALLARL